MASATNRSWKIEPEESLLDLELFSDLKSLGSFESRNQKSVFSVWGE